MEKHIGSLIRAKVSQTPGLSSKILAEKMGVHEQTIYDIYKRPALHTDVLAKISKILEVPVAYFLEGDETPETTEPLQLQDIALIDSSVPFLEENALRERIDALEARLRDKELIIKLLLARLRTYGEDYLT